MKGNHLSPNDQPVASTKDGVTFEIVEWVVQDPKPNSVDEEENGILYIYSYWRKTATTMRKKLACKKTITFGVKLFGVLHEIPMDIGESMEDLLQVIMIGIHM